MFERIKLNGNNWLFTARNDVVTIATSRTRDTHFWCRGTLPGSVKNNLLARGEIPNPYVSLNSLLIERIRARIWIYKKIFTIDIEPNVDGERVYLCFECDDYEAGFFLNDESLGRYVGMYT